jgi:hypothetical protein
MEEKMNLVFEDFKNNLESIDRYCELKKFRYDSTNVPDYSDNLMQQYYFLKYMPAYLVEYYEIYINIIKKDFIDDDYNVLSIGCGFGIDLWGLHFAMNQSENGHQIRYTGLDTIEWNYWDTCNEEAYFLNENINKREKLDEGNYNIIMFPKSIGEFGNEDFDKFKRAISNTDFTRNKIIFAASIRNTRIDNDLKRIEEIVNIMKVEKGYSALDNCNTYTYYLNKSNGYPYRINDLVNNYYYPEDIREYMINFYKNCQGYIENENNCCKDECETTFTRRPITTMSQVAFSIIRLEK